MHTFTDAAGTEWRVELDIAAAMAVDAAGIEVRGRTLILTDPERWFFLAMMRSPVLQCRLLYVLCRAQAEEARISETDFYGLLLQRIDDGLGGETTVLAQGGIAALGLEIADFFQSCPTSFNRLIRAQQQIVTNLLSETVTGLESDAMQRSAPQESSSAAAGGTTPSSVSPSGPDSTGGPPA